MSIPLSSIDINFNLHKTIPRSNGISDDNKLRQAANDFEAIFVQQMLKTMRETSLESNFIPKSEGEKYFRSLLDEQYSKLSAQSGSLGLGDMIYKQLKFKNDKN